MTMKWAEGFEIATNSNQLGRIYATFTGSFNTQAGRTFGNAGSPNNAVATSVSLGNADTWTIGFGMKLTSHTASIDNSNAGMYFEDGTDEQFHIGFLSTSGSGFQVKLFTGATEVAATGFLDFNVWHYFEMQVTINNTSGVYELRNNGVTLFSGTGANTALNGNTGADVFAWRFGSIAQAHFDDVYILDDAGAVNNDFLGPRIVEAIEVTANGATSAWTNDNTSTADADTWDQVNDPGESNPDDTGVGGTMSSDTNGQVQLFQMSDLVNVTGNINAVILHAQAAMSAAGTRNLRFKHGVTNAGDFTTDQTSFGNFRAVLETNPTLAAAWDVADVDSAEFGVEVVS